MLILLDAGHGGIIDGVYQTSGKRSPVWDDGSQLFEGEFNRWIANALAERLSVRGIPYVLISPEQRDVTLKTRVNRANSYADRECIFLSIHSNAGGGTGFEVFTTVGDTQSDPVAECLAKAFKAEFPEHRLRADMSDGDRDKEKNYYVLRKTAMPAVLTESFFMDTERECRDILLSTEGRTKIVNFHEAGIVNYINWKKRNP
ncbi:N-acetylmuramoyl-L-alanine amidase [Alginatibacterium sediminis]|uniref:N-acetylmuramoyl-L-alanine amidase n=1 Tax=Alginatibacterium sediminis TaxID=2164068 RepID=A0A420EGR8_9ALTE|nr:N-acetylmuramoyl-L-alanine amidase [Alginatibacterium sediminis]RKF19867.1 N-acetylmuramoyl-L-alanine amidase [Alginatibacterium sediminis]